jgi:hypothetical protein
MNNYSFMRNYLKKIKKSDEWINGVGWHADQNGRTGYERIR